MHCMHCGHGNGDDARFCNQCGRQLNAFSGESDDGNPDVEFLETAIGPKNTAYYLKRFEKFSSGQGYLSWNWPAFFISLIWLLYRKMWAYAAAYFFLPIIVAAFVYLALFIAFDEDVAFMWTTIVNYALIFVVFPIFANALYYRAIKAKIQEAKAVGTDRERQLRALASEGGTSAAFIVVMVFMLVPVAGILAAVAIPAYQDYIMRAQTVEGISLSEDVRAAVERSILEEDWIPGNRDEAGLTPDAADSGGQYVRTIDVVGGRVDIVYGNQATLRLVDKVLTMTPYLEELPDGSRRVLWRCAHAPVPAAATHELSEYHPGTLEPMYLPAMCRSGPSR